MNSNSTLYPFIIYLTLATGTFLLIPLIAMQFTDEVVWTLGDFIFAGTLIFGTSLTYKLVTRKAGDTMYRSAVGLALGSGFILIWANGAVGIIGSEANLINAWYYGVILVGLIGAFISQLDAKKMVVTMSIMAVAQGLIATVALIGGYYKVPHSSVMEVIGVNGFFITLFIVSALLFKNAYQEEPLTS